MGAGWHRSRALDRCRLYLCTGDRPDLVAFVSACIEGGVDVVQLREKHLDDSVLVARARLLRAACHERAVPFILNDRPDLVEAAGADGVHVGQEDMCPAEARRLIGHAALLGLSTHDSSQLEAATKEPVDYISVGPVVPTPTKPGRPGTGLAYVTEAAAVCGGRVDGAARVHGAAGAGGAGAGRAGAGAGRRGAAGAGPAGAGHAGAGARDLPFFVTGDARPGTVPAMIRAGARRFVVVRWLTEAADPRSAALALSSAIDEALEPLASRGPEEPAGP